MEQGQQQKWLLFKSLLRHLSQVIRHGPLDWLNRITEHEDKALKQKGEPWLTL